MFADWVQKMMEFLGLSKGMFISVGMFELFAESDRGYVIYEGYVYLAPHSKC